MKEIIVNVKGMVCGGCENRIKNAIGTVEGVKEVEASYETGIVKVLGSENVKRNIEGKTIKKIIVVKNKIVSIVVA